MIQTRFNKGHSNHWGKSLVETGYSKEYKHGKQSLRESPPEALIMENSRNVT